MTEYFASHPLVALILVMLALLTAFVCVKAAQASKKRYAENEKIMNKLKEDNRLRNDFSVLTRENVSSCEPSELFKGVALNLEKKIAESSDMEQAFAALTQEQREVYSLYFVLEDGGERLSGFFAANGSPLTDTAYEAVKKLLPEGAAAFEKELRAHDSRDETTSYIKSDIEKWDDEFASAVSTESIARAGGKYISENFEKFI